MAIVPPRIVITPKVTAKFSRDKTNPNQLITFTWECDPETTSKIDFSGTNIEWTNTNAPLSGSKLLRVSKRAKPGDLVYIRWEATSPTGDVIRGKTVVSVVSTAIPPDKIIYPKVNLTMNGIDAGSWASTKILTSLSPGQSVTVNWQSRDAVKIELYMNGLTITSGALYEFAGQKIVNPDFSGSFTATVPFPRRYGKVVVYNYRISALVESSTGMTSGVTFPFSVIFPLPPPPPPIVPVITGTFDPAPTIKGETSVFTWTTDKVAKISLGSSDVAFKSGTLTGVKDVKAPPTVSKKTQISIYYAASTADDQVRKGSFVLPIIPVPKPPPPEPPKVIFTVGSGYNPPTKLIPVGGEFMITWESTNVTTLKIVGLDFGLTTTELNATQRLIAPSKSGTYLITITAVGPGGKYSVTEMIKVAEVVVVPPPAPEPTVQINFTPNSVRLGVASSTVLYWQATNVDSIILKSSPQLAVNSSAPSGTLTLTVPTVPGVYTATITINRTNGSPIKAEASLTILSPEALVILPATYQLPDCLVDTAYNYNYTATGGVPPYRFSVELVAGLLPLPHGLTMDPTTGSISGTPIATQKKQATFTAVVTDSLNATARIDCAIKITTKVADLKISGWPNNMQLTDGEVGNEYRYEFAAEGGVPPYVFSVAPGSSPLPDALTLSTTGLLSGITTTATPGIRLRGTNVLIQVTDSVGTKDSKDFFLIVRPSTAPTYSVKPAAISIDEGSTLIFNVTTTNVKDGTTLYWEIYTGEGSNYAATDRFAAISGSFTVTNNMGSFLVGAIANRLTDLPKIFRVRIRPYNGPVLDTSTVVVINDTSKALSYVSLIAAKNLNEDAVAVEFTLTTTGAPDGTVVYWTTDSIIGVGIKAGDFTDDTLNGTVTITGNKAIIYRAAKADLTGEKGAEPFRLQIRETGYTSPVKISSNYVNISDTSTGGIKYVSFTATSTWPANPTVITEGETDINLNRIYSGLFQLTTTDAPDGTVVYWTTAGTVTAADFIDAKLQGTLTIQKNKAFVTRIARDDRMTEGPEAFRLEIREDSYTSPIKISSDIYIGIVDTSTGP